MINVTKVFVLRFLTHAEYSKNKWKQEGSLVVANDEGWTVVELLGSEGEISVGDTVFGDWDAVAGEDLIFNDQKFDAFFQGTGSKEWALGLIARWGGS